MNVITSVVCMGAHILDVLVRPVSEIPSGQDTVLVAQGLGSDHGDFDLAGADAFAETAGRS